MLPKVNSILGSVNLPVLKKTVRVKSFTLKEEKILVFNKDFSENISELYTTILELLKACVIDSLDVESLTQTDATVLFLKIIELSKGTEVAQRYVCRNKNPSSGEECGKIVEIVTDLSDYTIVVPETEKDNNILSVDDKVKIVVRYPSMMDTMRFLENETEESMVRLFADCITEVYEGTKSSVRGTGFTEDEIYEWTNTLPLRVLKSFSEFISTMPYVEKKIEITCPSCGSKEEINVMSLSDFFTLDTPKVP